MKGVSTKEIIRPKGGPPGDEGGLNKGNYQA